MSTKLQIAPKEEAGNDPQVRISEEEQGVIQLWQTIGAVKLANSLANSLGSQAIHALEKVRDEKLYLSSGFSTFDEFLSKHPGSPMSHDTFRRRVNLLETEGDVVFDLLNSLKVPMSARALLAGQVSVNGNMIEIGEAKIALDDRSAIVSLITTLHKKDVQQERTIERGKKENEKHKRRADEAENRLARGGTVAAESTPHAGALMSLLGSFQMLNREVKAIEDEAERKRFTTVALEHLATAQKQLEAAFGFFPPEIDLGNLDDADKQDLLDAED